MMYVIVFRSGPYQECDTKVWSTIEEALEEVKSSNKNPTLDGSYEIYQLGADNLVSHVR